MRVLVIEDGSEYFDALSRFLPSHTFDRAGSGPAAIACLATQSYDAIYLDMCFDRAPPAELLGDLEEAADRFNGDPVQARAFLQDHQGTYVLQALRAAGCALPIVFSYDFTNEPRRFERLAQRYGPLDYCPEGSGPHEVARRLAPG